MMDIGGLIILLIVIACVAALIVFSVKRKSEADVSSSKSSDEHGATSQITVYRYRSDTHKKVCPICDSENDENAICCSVCGGRI